MSGPRCAREVGASAVAAAVLAHPAVARLHGGPFGTVASYLPGRRVVGVRIGAGGEPVELAVVVRLGPPLRRVADELGAVVRGLLGPVPVEVTFADVVSGDAPDPDPGAGPDAPTAPPGSAPPDP